MEELEQNSIRLTIEAILFHTTRCVPINEILNQFPSASLEELRAIFDDLINDYQKRDSAFEILHNSDDSFTFQVRQKILSHPKVRIFSQGKQFDAKVTEVLAFIALNQPITIPDMVEFLGKKILPIVQCLDHQGLIQTEPQVKGTTSNENLIPYITTALFADYMGIPNNIELIKQTIQTEFENQQQKQERKIQRKQKSTGRPPSEEISEAEIHSAAAKFDEIY